MPEEHRDVMESVVGQGEQRIRAAVVEMLEAEGYDAVQVREVARRARVSLGKIYKLYGTRDELILAALQRWLAENRYAGLAEYTPDPGVSLHEALMGVLRPIFEPWEQHPGLLIAYFRARAASGGELLVRRGFEAVVPAAMTALDGVDPDFVQDLGRILSSLVYGLLGRFAGGEIAVTEILPTVDRTVYWLTTGYRAGGGPIAESSVGTAVPGHAGQR
ncbi:TetR family transcriptional regulator [Nocardia asteroides]|uniref:TetR family transcriptional regulator n=1 Tax=Nocardia asteroides TaxID=1824 RepID=UPI003B3A8BD6